MNAAPRPDAHYLHEYHALCSAHGAAQRRCSRLVGAQQKRIDALEVRCLRLQAELVLRDTALAWALDDATALGARIPGLPKRVRLFRLVEALAARVRNLMPERSNDKLRLPPPSVGAANPGSPVRAAASALDVDAEDPIGLEASLVAADLVICQTGCMSHGAYWRVQDHCKRTGKTCVLVDHPEALRIVRFHRPERAGTTTEAPRAAASENTAP